MGASRRLIVLAAVSGLAALAGLAGLGATMSTAAAGAAPRRAADESSSTTPPTSPPSVVISGGLSFSAGSVSGPGLIKPRALTAYQSAVFAQSWLGYSLYGKPKQQSPPARLRVYRVDLTGTWNGELPEITMAAYYASDGKHAWIAFPPQTTSTNTPSTRPPIPSRWFLALPRTIPAFAGTAKLVPTAGTESAPTTTTLAEQHPVSGTGTSSSVWIAVAGAAVIAVGAGVWLNTRRRNRG